MALMVKTRDVSRLRTRVRGDRHWQTIRGSVFLSYQQDNSGRRGSFGSSCEEESLWMWYGIVLYVWKSDIVEGFQFPGRANGFSFVG